MFILLEIKPFHLLLNNMHHVLVLQKRGKFIAFLLQFFSHRPAISQLKQSGIVKDRLFGSDLGEHLANAGLLSELNHFSHVALPTMLFIFRNL